MTLDRTPPTRLKETDKGLQALSNRSFSKERLSLNKSQIENRIQSLPEGAGSTLMGKAFGMGMLALVTAASLWMMSPQEEAAKSEQPLPANLNPSTSQEPMNTEPGDTSKIQEQALPVQGSNPQALPAKSKPDPLPAPSQEVGKFKHMQKAPLRIGKSSSKSKTKESQIAPPANLGAEIQAFRKAKESFEKQDYEQALSLLRQLHQEFSNPSLKTEVSLLTAQTLLALNRTEEALNKLQDLMSSSTTKPQGQWYKLEGDIHRAQNQCGQALLAYSRALKSGLSEEQEQQVSTSVRACSQPQ